MSTLLYAQWRLVRTSTIVFTGLGILVPPLTDGAWMDFSIAPPHVSVFVVWLAASLAARLFAQDLVQHDTPWWRGLPISEKQWFMLKLGLGLAVLAASFLVQWAAWHTPLYDLLFDLTRRDDYQLAVSPLHALDTMVLAVLTFAVTVYFATSFERREAAIQAGLPGYGSAVALIFAVGSDELVLHPWRAWPAIVSMIAGALFIAHGLWRRRAGVIAPAGERLLARGSRLDVGLHVIGQGVFVALPLWIVATGVDFTIPHLSSRATGAALLLCAGLICLPWTIREARRLGESTVRGAAALALRTSGLGIPLWKALRNGSSTLTCVDCGRARDAGLRACPRCLSVAVQAKSPGWFRRSVPSTPWGVFIVSMIPLLFVQNLVRMFVPIGNEHWIVQPDLPGTTITSSETGRSADLLELELVGPRVGSTGFISSGSGWRDTESAHLTNPIRVADLRTAMSGPGTTERSESVWPRDDTFTVGDPTRGDTIESAELAYGHEKNRLTSRVVLRVRRPRLEDEANRILDLAAAGPLTPETVERAAAMEEALITLLVRTAVGRPPSARGSEDVSTTFTSLGSLLDASEQAAIDAIVCRRYGITPGTIDVDVARRALAELESRRRLLSPDESRNDEVMIRIEFFYAPLRALALSAPESLLRAEIRDRNDFAAIAAGMQKRAGLLTDCRLLFAVSVDSKVGRDGRAERRRQSAAAAWAMLRIDRDASAATILEALLHQQYMRDMELWKLLAHSECASMSAPLKERLLLIFGPRADVNDVPEQVRMVITGIEAGRHLEDFWFDR